MKKWGIKSRFLFLALVPAAVVSLLLTAYFAVTWLNDLEQSLPEFALNSLAIIFLCLLVTVLLALHISKGVTMPVQRLAEALKRSQDGEFDTVVSSDSVGELQALDDGFNSMAATLRAAQANLQQRIDEATAQLRDSLEAVEQKNIELTKSEGRFRSVFESIQDIYYKTDVNGVIVDGSPSSAQMLGYTREQLIGIPAADMYANPDERKTLLRLLQERGAVNDYEINLRHRDGHIVPVSVTSRVIFDDSGKPAGVEGMLREISERKRVEAALRESEERFRAIFESIQDVYFRVDIDGVVKMVSPSSAVQLGYPPAEVIGRDANSFYADAEGRDKLIAQMKEHGIVNDFEISFRHKDGHVIPTSVSSHFVCDDIGNPIATEGTLRNISGRKRAEADLAKAHDAALAATRAKSEFLANMSHEIRTPLNGILGFLSLLEDTELNATQRDYLRTVRTSTKQLLGIINDILDFSKIEAGKLTIESIDFNLRKVVEDAVSLFAAGAHAKGLDLESVIDSDVPVWLIGDPGKITQVITNLVGNAIKFTSTGEVVVRVKIGHESGAQAVIMVSVTDTGIGMSESDQEHLFKAFSQADTSTARKYGGTGLGLIISRKLVSLMGGEMGLVSAFGKGSCFWFTFSFKEQEAPVSSETARDALVGRGLLVVTPNDALAAALQQILLPWGVVMSRARKAGEASVALESTAAEGGRHEVVVVDTVVGRARVEQLLEEVSDTEGGNDVKAIVLCSTSNYPEYEQMRQAGRLLELVRKPPRASELQEALLRCYIGRTACLAETDKTAAAEIQRQGKPPGKQVLLVDDNETNRKLAGIMLQNLGAKVDEAVDGVQAVDAARMKQYDIIFMDVHMPNMDGIEATRNIRKMQHNNGSVPIIALTANAMQGDRERFIDAGMDDYISKPVTEESIRSIMSAWLDKTEPKVAYDPGPIEGASVNEKADLAVLDEELGTRLASGDVDVWKTVLRMLLQDLPENVREIETAFVEGDLDNLGYLVHKLHGSTSYCGTPALQQTAKALERACLERDAEQITRALDMLKEEAQKLIDLEKPPDFS